MSRITKSTMKHSVTFLVMTTLIVLSGYSRDNPAEQSTNESAFSAYVDEKGNISRPQNFRENWVHLGSWIVKEDDMASGPGVHDVYATQESVKAFRETGEWQDGAILIKTVSDIRNKQLTTGNAQWAGEVGIWFVMIRDRKNRFPENKAWGEGWGWALFKSDQPDVNLTINWRGTGFNNCFGCHAPARNTDWVYIDGYPTIRNSARFPKLGMNM